MIPLIGQSQLYHESNDGVVKVLSYDSTQAIVTFDVAELQDVSLEYDSIQGLKHKACYRYNWAIINEERIDYKGLFVVKNEDGSIYTVWLYEDTEDGRGRLSKMLKDNFDY